MQTSAAPVLIAGQGLAGTLLAFALELAGRAFFLVDPGHAACASRVGAGLVNPVTGERWVAAPGWAIKAAEARASYTEIEQILGLKLLTPLRIRREWHDAVEAKTVREKTARGELAPWVTPAGLEPDAAWIDGAWRVDLPTLITAARARWVALGRLREAAFTTAEAATWPGPVIWCLGAAEGRVSGLRAVGGETLELAVPPDSLACDVVRHDGVWVLPVEPGRLWAGASFVRDEAERSSRREELRASVRRQLAGVPWREVAVLAGWRMTTPDRAPRSDWLPGREGREGVFNGLGSKGGLLAPGLAHAWAERLAVIPG